MERHLDVPVLQIHGSSATSSRFLQFLGGTRNNLELARSTKHRGQFAHLLICFRL